MSGHTPTRGFGQLYARSLSNAHIFSCRLAQLFFIEIKCSALNLKYLSQYLNGFGCPRVPLDFQNLIFGL